MKVMNDLLPVDRIYNLYYMLDQNMYGDTLLIDVTPLPFKMLGNAGLITKQANFIIK